MVTMYKLKKKLKMKKQWLIILIGLLVALGAYANDSDLIDERVELIPLKSGVYKLVYKSNHYPNAQVIILNGKGAEIYKELINGRKDFIKSYNLSPLGSGTYTFRVKDRSGKVEKKVNFDKSESVNLSKVKYSYNVSLFMDNELNKVVVRIFDDLDQLLMKEEVPSGSRYQRVFNFSKLKSKEVTFVITDEWGIIEKSTFKVERSR